MRFRLLLGLTFTLGWCAKASACSCYLWEGGNVSDLYTDKANVSLWVLPTKGVMKEREADWEKFYISYELRVLESFGQIQDKRISAISSIQDGASCGVQLDLGNPHFLTMSRASDGAYGISSCHPQLPYNLVKTYLETGVDAYVPGIHECRDDNDEIKKIEACSVWASSEYSGKYGGEDTIKYIEQLRNEPKKKRPWWQFKKD